MRSDCMVALRLFYQEMQPRLQNGDNFTICSIRFKSMFVQAKTSGKQNAI